MEIIKTRPNSEPQDINIDPFIKDIKIEISVERIPKRRVKKLECEVRLAPIKRGRKSSFIDSIKF